MFNPVAIIEIFIRSISPFIKEKKTLSRLSKNSEQNYLIIYCCQQLTIITAN